MDKDKQEELATLYTQRKWFLHVIGERTMQIQNLQELNNADILAVKDMDYKIKKLTQEG